MMTTEKMGRINKAIHLYTTTSRTVRDILNECDVLVKDFYDEIDIQGIPRRGVARGIDYYKPALSKEEVKAAVKALAEGETTSHRLAKEKGVYRSTIQRALADTMIDCIKRGEDIREWLK